MITNTWLRITAWAAGLVAVAALLNIIALLYEPLIRPVLDVLLPFSIAVALALLLDPAIDRMEKRGMPRGRAVAVVALCFLLVIAVFGVFVVPVLINQAKELADNLPGYYTQAQDYVGRWMAGHAGLLRRFHAPTTMKALYAQISAEVQSAASGAISGAGALLANWASKSIWLVLIPIITLFMLADIDRIKAKALLLVPEKHRERTGSIVNSIGRVFGSYIRGLITVAVLYGTSCGIALAIWRVPYSVMLGAAAGALSLVPYIGTFSTIVLVALVALVSHPENPMYAVWVALTILVINQTFDNGVTPKVVGKAVGVHPALAILALLIGGQMFGIVGMIISVPVAASIQIVVLEFYPPLRGPKEKRKKREKPGFFSRLWQRKATSPKSKK